MNEKGFSIEREVVTSRECDALIETLSRNIRVHGRAGARNLLGHPTVATLAKDPRVMRIASQALGGAAVPFRATLFDKSVDSNWLVAWHQDTVLPLVSRFDSFEWGPWSQKAGVLFARAPAWALRRVVALRIQLDDAVSANGPLRVIPGSHRLGVLSSDDILDVVRQQRHFECLAARGSILVMWPLLIHSSSRVRAKRHRRVLHIEYAGSLHLADKISLAIA